MIALDSNIFIYALDGETEFVAEARKVLELVSSGAEKGLASVLVLTEVMRRPKVEVEVALLSIPNMEYCPVTKDIALLAARLSRKYPSLNSYDEMHIATAAHCGADKFYTNDKGILKANISEIKVIGLSV
jgi:predicted nucleic acid-binding protein